MPALAKAATQHSYRPVQIGHVLGNAVTAVGEETKVAECEVSLKFASDLPPVLGDALALERMFQNLISNAARHGASGKWIGITAARNNDAVEIRVADRGAGIPREEQEEIFKPFVRGEQAQERAIRGSGLGLSVVKEIVTAHGGSVSVESSVGQGTTFIVRLPVQASAT